MTTIEQLAHVAALHDRLEDIHGHLAAGRCRPEDSSKRNGEPGGS
jgi:hypothetical protein